MAVPSSSSTAATATIQLSTDILAKFRPAKVFNDALERPKASPADLNGSKGPYHVTSIAFDDRGDKCLTAGDNEGFVLWDAKKGKKERTFWSLKYGIAHARFTHRAQNIIHASTRGNDDIRYHSVHTNQYLAYFSGHTAPVRSLDLCPIDDTFLSAGDDGTVRLWDLRAQTCKAVLNDVGGSALAAFDSSGQVFAVACSETQTVMLYAATSMDSAPFHHAPLIDPALAGISQPPPKPIFTSLSFSNNGSYLLIGTSSDVHYVLDAYTLAILRRLVGHQGLGRALGGAIPSTARRGMSGEETGWSGDSRWVVSGSADGSVHLWDLSPPPGKERIELDNVPSSLMYKHTAETLRPAVTLSEPVEGHRRSPIRAAKFNPRYAMTAFGGDELSFWLPLGEETAKEGW